MKLNVVPSRVELSGSELPVFRLGRRLMGLTGALWTGGRRGARQMEVIETLSLGAKRQLVLVSCGGERFLVGAGSDGVQTIVAIGGAK